MAFTAHGSLLKIGDGGSPVSYTTIAEITEFDMDISGETEEVTNHDTSPAYAEHVATFRNATVSGTLNYLPADSTHDATDGVLNDLDQGKNDRQFQIVWADDASTTWEFTAIVTSFNPSAPVDGALQADFELQMTGSFITIN